MTPINNAPCIADAPEWLRCVMALLERQAALVDRLCELAAGQATLVEHGDADQLLELLGRRQEVIDDFTQCQNEFTAQSEGLEPKLQTVEPRHRDCIRRLIDHISERLAQVMRHDERDQSQLRHSRGAVQQELAGLGSAKQARAAYGGAGSTPGFTTRFADRHG